MALTSKSRGKVDDAQDQIAQMREQVDALTQDRITPVVADFIGKAGTAAAIAKGAVQERAQVVSGQVKERPLVAILIAAAVGWIIGRIMP